MSTATEKFKKKYTEVVKTIEKNFADLKAGEKMLISSPRSIAVMFFPTSLNPPTAHISIIYINRNQCFK